MQIAQDPATHPYERSPIPPKINPETSKSSHKSISVSNEMNRMSKLTLSESGAINSQLFVIIIALTHGLFEIASLSSFFYQKNELQLNPQFIQMVAGLISFPWCIKPVFGYITDNMVRRLKKTKYIIIVTSLIKIMCYSLLAHVRVGVGMFYLACFLNCLCSLFENIIAEYILVINTKRENERNGDTKGNQLPFYFGFRAAGSLIGTFSGGRIIKYYGAPATFFICSMLPTITICSALMYRDRPVSESEDDHRNFKDEVKIMKQLIFKDKVLLLICFICLINMTPNFDMLVTFYLTDHLKFTSEDLANFSSFATVCYIMGLLLYSAYFKNIEPRKFYIGTNFLLWIFNLSFLLVVLKTVEAWGINNKLFCFLSQGATSFIAEINFMPILAIWCSICPRNLEATSITLFTGLLNFSGNLSNYIGSIIIWFMGISKENYNDIWKPIVIQNTYLLIMMTGLLFIEFPNPIPEDKKDKEPTDLTNDNPCLIEIMD